MSSGRWKGCWIALFCAMIVSTNVVVSAVPIQIEGIGTGSLDQPRVVLAFENPTTNTFYEGEAIDIFGGGGTTIALEAFLDTGANFTLISNAAIESETGFGLPVESGWVFSDVAADGLTDFLVLGELNVYQANFNTTAAGTGALDWENPSHYSFVQNNIRLAGGTGNSTPGSPDDPAGDLDELLGLLGQVNVAGMPFIKGKVMVNDGRPLNDFILGSETSDGQIATYLYDPGTPFNAGTETTDPGIPVTELHIQTVKADFRDFVSITPEGVAEIPAFEGSPFIGTRNPIDEWSNQGSGGGDEDRMKFTNNGRSVYGDILYDTGAAVNIISETLAKELGVRYQPGFEPGNAAENPVNLQQYNAGTDTWTSIPAIDQYNLSVTGAGGTITLAGTFLDSAFVPTIEGKTDPDLNLEYIEYPTLIFDISTLDMDTGAVFELDGVFGMNNLYGTAFVDEPIDIFALLGSLTPGAFDWVTYDDTTGIIGLSFDERIFSISSVPEPGTALLLLTAGALAMMRRRR